MTMFILSKIHFSYLGIIVIATLLFTALACDDNSPQIIIQGDEIIASVSGFHNFEYQSYGYFFRKDMDSELHIVIAGTMVTPKDNFQMIFTLVFRDKIPAPAEFDLAIKKDSAKGNYAMVALSVENNGNSELFAAQYGSLNITAIDSSAIAGYFNFRGVLQNSDDDSIFVDVTNGSFLVE